MAARRPAAAVYTGRVTILDQDEREISLESDHYNARLVRRVDETDDLAYFWVKYDGDPVPFAPGQYMTIGVYADGKIVQRPYSVASPPRESGDGGYEFYVRLVPVMRFTTLLWRLPVGHGMRMIGPKGKFVLEPDDDRTHLYVSTGTGIAPFISMIRDTMDAPRKTVMLHGCSYADELGYRDVIEGWERDGTYPVTLRADDLATGRPAQRRLDRSHGARRGGGSNRSVTTSGCERTAPSSTSSSRRTSLASWSRRRASPRSAARPVRHRPPGARAERIPLTIADADPEPARSRSSSRRSARAPPTWSSCSRAMRSATSPVRSASRPS
jgi:ferredoxin-NADP reductase